MELYIVRHGETGYNKMGLLQGRTDIPLNQNGIKQALLAHSSLQNISFDVVMTSPLKRAIETAATIVPRHSIIIEPRLEERYLGNFEGKPSRIYDQALYHDYYQNCTVGGVEGIQDLVKRIGLFLEELKMKYAKQTVLLVTHGGWINAFLYCVEQIPSDGKLKRIGLKNGEYIKYSL